MKKYITVWTCDYCDKEFKTKKESDKHELICEKNKNDKDVILNIKPSKIGSIFLWIFSFLILYLFTYFIVNNDAQNKGLPMKDLLQPQKWFLLETLEVGETKPPKLSIDEYKNELRDLINNYRVSQGLGLLKENLLLDKSACLKLEDMNNPLSPYWSHVSPKGLTPWSFFNKVGYKYYLAGENLAKDFYKPKQTFEAWLDSKEHKVNIVGNFTEDGMCVMETRYGSYFVVHHFGKPEVANKNNTSANSKTQTNEVDCIGPDDKQFKTTLSECEKLNNSWGKSVDYMTNCQTTPACGSETKYIKNSECKNSTCCQIGDKWIFYLSIDKCKEDQSKYYSSY